MLNIKMFIAFGIVRANPILEDVLFNYWANSEKGDLDDVTL